MYAVRVACLSVVCSRFICFGSDYRDEFYHHGCERSPGNDDSGAEPCGVDGRCADHGRDDDRYTDGQPRIEH